ncbi:unnamed protein product [Allacma fusca]|uniref:Uncharacterized protein n=1 Tax=Allacma fusca TaxID=39272 RepID=A0A8J2JF45_9HEXA|nr:unnamed protein product [Allacma fusca]
MSFLFNSQRDGSTNTVKLIEVIDLTSHQPNPLLYILSVSQMPELMSEYNGVTVNTGKEIGRLKLLCWNLGFIIFSSSAWFIE